MRPTLLYLMLLLLMSLSAGAANPEWVALDKKVISEVGSLIKGSPAKVEAYFKKEIRETHDLGFGWKSWDGARYGGYVQVLASFYYYKGALVSYIVYPELPDHKELQDMYSKWYTPAFKVEARGVAPFYYNGAALQRALPSYRNTTSPNISTNAVLAYMSPESGLEYGYAGGESLTLLENRKRFLEIQNSLSVEQVLLIMHAVNPASRLTAIEYYLKHKASFSDRPQIEQWIETVFQELPEVESIEGCIGGKYDARELVAGFTKAD